MPAPLTATQQRLRRHFEEAAIILEGAVDVAEALQLVVDWDASPVIAALAGQGCELIPRNRGARVHVAPLLHLKQGLWAWLGYREEWDRDNNRRFSFRSAGITIHFGWKYDTYKPQMFRAEWAGWAKWNGPEYCFQAADAGHPHWQFDALDSLPNEEAADRADMLREILEDQARTGVREFSPQLPEDDIRDLVADQKLSRMHFPSAAAWWKDSPHNQHAHSPNSLLDLQTWLSQSLFYLSSELERLQAA